MTVLERVIIWTVYFQDFLLIHPLHILSMKQAL
ncbi:hypothetical protein LEAN103870_07100 [Legionella anisa]